MYRKGEVTYQPLPLPDRVAKPDDIALAEAEAFLTHMRQRHSVRQFSSRSVPEAVIRTILATAAILKFLVMYNQYLWPLMVTQEEGYRPVMVGLQYFFQLNVAWGEVMAYLSLITVPVLAFYLYLQKAFIASIASTGVKG